MQSKFWANESSSSDSDSEASSDVQADTQTQSKTNVRAAQNRWVNVESSSDEEARRVVRSAKDKRWELLRDIIKRIEQRKKILDYGGLTDDYEALQKAVHKSRNLIEQGGYPNFLIRAHAELEDYVAEQSKDRQAFKKLTKMKATNLNTLKAKVKKGGDEYKDKINEFREDPKLFESSDQSASEDESSDMTTSSDDSSSDSDEISSTSEKSSDDDDDKEDTQSEEEETIKTKKSGAAVKKEALSDGSNDEADDESSDWGDSDSDSDSSSDESDAGDREFADKHQRALHKWGLKADDKDKSKRKTPKDRATRVATAAAKKKEREKEREVSGLVSGSAPQGSNSLLSGAVSALLEGSERVDADTLTKAVGEIMAQRGKKSTDRSELIRTLQQLVDTAEEVGPRSIMEILGHLISGYFDTNLGAFSCLVSTYWLEAYKHVMQALTIFVKHPTALFHASTVTSELSDYTDKSDGGKLTGEGRTASMIAAFLDRLDDELTKALQFVDVHSEDYKDRLRQSTDLLVLLWYAYTHFLSRGMNKLAGVVALRILEHVYYRADQHSSKVWEIVRKQLPSEVASTLPAMTTPEAATGLLDSLIACVLAHSENVTSRIRVVLHKSYNRAICDSYYDAKDLLYLCQIQELASQADVSTQILHNRCLTQLGLCAFRHGLVQEAHSCLSDICAMNRHRELLAQGVSITKNQEKTSEQEREEKRRLLPYHMHISLDLIEGVHNLCAMLLEVPHMAARPFDHHRNAISKQFRRMLDMHDRQLFAGPPENPRETIIAATRALQKGDAVQCCKHVFNLRIWEQMPNRDAVQEIIRAKIKAEALRTYLFTFSSIYHSFSISQLTSMYDMSPATAHSIVSKMMVKEELSASWDESSECVIINRVDPSPLQVVALQLAESVVHAVDQNELLMNFKKRSITFKHKKPF